MALVRLRKSSNTLPVYVDILPGAQQDGFQLHLGAAERGSRAHRQTGPEQADAHGAIFKRRESDSGDGRVLFHEKMTVAVRQP